MPTLKFSFLPNFSTAVFSNLQVLIRISIKQMYQQVVVVPYPGRGHINPLLNLCHLLSSRLNKRDHKTILTFLVTEEWLGFINPGPEHANIRFVTIPNVLPSELNRGSDMIAFLTSVKTKMEHPFQEVLDRMVPPVELIIADATMMWPFDAANKRNIPVAAYWPMSASMFSLLYHAHLLESHNQLFADVSEQGNEYIDYIPGLSPLTISDIPMLFHDGIGQKFKGLVPDPFKVIKKAQCVLLSTIYELESEAIDALISIIQIPIYTCGPNIPYSQIKPTPSPNEQPIYLKWLDAKPPRSVLYVSLGSFLSVSSAEMDEIAAGLKQSGVTFLWVARGETARLKEMCGEDGMVVEWCDQLRVLLHPSIGGFWTHCGSNSVKEGLFSGVPMLTFPLLLDQPLNSKMIIEDWKISLKMRKDVGVYNMRDDISSLVRRFMDAKSVDRIGMMERANELQKICQESIIEGGSAVIDLNAFLTNVAVNRNK